MPGTITNTTIDGSNRAAEENTSLSSKLAVGAINFYRKYISPHKGFNCASGVMGLPSCSSQGLHHFKTLPLRDAMSAQRETFDTCHQMYEIFNIAVGNDAGIAAQQVQMQYGKTADEAQALVMRAQKYEEERKKKRERGSSSSCKDNNKGSLADCCDPTPMVCWMPRGSGAGAKHCDDIGDCDVGPCDCSP